MAEELKTIEQVISEGGISPEMREIYAEFGGLEQLLAPSENPIARIQAATQYGENVRAHAKMEAENRARAERKAKMAEEAEARAQERHIEDERAAAEDEAKLMARLRREYPKMTDAAWNQQWSSIRSEFYRAEHIRRMHAIENDEALGEMRGTQY
jgi:predicted DNA-binding protein (UPF0278 family)